MSDSQPEIKDSVDGKSQDTGYRFDLLEADAIALMIDRSFRQGGNYLATQRILSSELLDHFKSSDIAPSPDDAEERAAESDEVDAPSSHPIVHELDRLLFYELDVPHQGPVTCELAPMQREDDFAWPPWPADVTPPVAELWQYLSEIVEAPAVRARLYDLTFMRGVDRFASAVAARDAYLVFGGANDVVDLDEAYGLLRAWTLDRKLKRAPAEAESRSAIQAALERAWDAGERAAGVLLPMLGALCRPRVQEDEEDHVPVDRLLLRASRLYRTTDSVQYIGDLRRARARDDEERRAVNEWQVGCQAEIARMSEGLVKAIRLKEAIVAARRYHLSALAAELTRELQSLPSSDVQLQTLSSEIPLSRIPIERYMQQFTSDRDWRVALARFNRTPVPTGIVVDLEDSLRERLARPGIIDLVQNVLLDEDRLPQWEPTTEEERHQYMMAREAGWNASYHGHILSDILTRIRRRYGPVPESELTAYLAYEGRGNTELAAVLARSMIHYWRGDLEAAVHVAVPRVESAVRLILKELDIAIYQTQIGERPGMYPQLANLLSLLPELGLDEDWIYFLDWLLVNHAGKNLRNELAHGRTRSISPSDAALAIRALMLVTALAGPGQTDDDVVASHPAFRGGAPSMSDRDLRSSASRVAKIGLESFPARWKVALHLAVVRLTSPSRRM